MAFNRGRDAEVGHRSIGIGVVKDSAAAIAVGGQTHPARSIPKIQSNRQRVTGKIHQRSISRHGTRRANLIDRRRSHIRGAAAGGDDRVLGWLRRRLNRGHARDNRTVNISAAQHEGEYQTRSQ